MKTIQEQIDDLNNLSSDEYKLSDWELNFLDSISRQLKLGKTLSEKQNRTVDKIWDDAFIHKERKFR